MEENNDGFAYAIIGFILLVVIIFVVVFAIKQFNKNYQVDTIIGDNTPKHFSIESYWQDEKQSGVQYQLLNGGVVVQEGELRNDLIEKVQELRNNTNYTLKTKDSRFYDSETICNSNVLVCSAQLEKYPNLQLYAPQLSNNYFRVLMYVDDGILKDPVICVSDNSFRVRNMQLRMGQMNKTLATKIVPSRLRMFYDKCYALKSEDEVRESVRNKIAEGYENNIKAYNKEKKLNLGDWNDITITEEDMQRFRSEDIVTGLYEYDLSLEIDTIYGYNQDSNLKIILLDQYSLTRTVDIDVPDKELVIPLK